MCVQTVKFDGEGNPDCVKSRIIALGNHKYDIWSKSDQFAPVISQSNHCLLTSMACEMRRQQKQGDCNNTFLHPVLPETETVICRPPLGCPLSDPNIPWLFKKAMCGLHWSPYHWFKHITDAFKKSGLVPLANDPCIYTGVLVVGEPPIHIGLYVNNFTYFMPHPGSS